MKQQTLERVKERLALIDRMRAGGEAMEPQFSEADVRDLIKEIDRSQRMLLAACCNLGEIGEALGADMDDDGDVMLGLAKDLKQDAERYRWLRSAKCETCFTLDARVDDHIECLPSILGDDLDALIDSEMAKQD